MYMNQIYLKDNFLMIRDGDGKDSDMPKNQLCRYYEERNAEKTFGDSRKGSAGNTGY